MGGEKLKPSRPFAGLHFAAILAAAFLFCAAFPMHAQSVTEESAIIIGETPDVPVSSGGSSVFVVLRMILVLALAALAIYGIVFFIKRFARPRERRDPYLKVLARVPLGSDSFAAVVSVGAKAWLVGGGSGGVNLISEIDDPESLETMLLDDARRAAEGGTGFIDFRSLIRRLGGASGGHTENPRAAQGETGSLSESGSLTEKLRRKRERLKGL